jgi:hypothetical protein
MVAAQGDLDHELVKAAPGQGMPVAMPPMAG